MLNGIKNRLPHGIVAACATSLAVLTAAAPAFATPDHSRIAIGGSFHYNSGPAYPPVRPAPCPPQPVVIAPSQPCNVDPYFAQQEFDRGASRGDAAGRNQGYRDGLNGKVFCADVRDDLCDNTRFYRDGYFSTFGKSYRYAFEQGRAQRERACSRPVFVYPQHCR